MLAMPQCYCLHPVIIKNHVDRYKINTREWYLYLRGREVFHVPSPRKARIQECDLDSCYFLNKRSGEMVPMYIQVPCNKCILCGDKKAKDWSTRLFAEANFHDNHPWWITLTYNAYGLPLDKSISKKELSNFLKRLRERVSRVFSKDIRLRFVGVGEYGFNNARPHYHLELFGMPKMCVTKVLLILENAWSCRVTLKRYSELPTDFRFVRFDKNGKKMYYQRKGFVYVKPAHDNTPLYLAKYMFKPELNTPFGCTPNFCLSSRKNGIGYDYAQSVKDWYRNHPEVVQVSIRNKFTGSLKTFGVPTYFKDIWFPTTSKCLPPEVNKELKNFRCLYDAYNSLLVFADKHRITLFSDVDSMASDISKKYSFMPEIDKISLDYYISDFEYFLKHRFYSIPKDGYHYVEFFGFKVQISNYEVKEKFTIEDFIKQTHFTLYNELMLSYNYVMSLEFDTDVFEATVLLREKFKASLSVYLNTQPEVDVNDCAYKLRRRWVQRKSKDMN